MILNSNVRCCYKENALVLHLLEIMVKDVFSFYCIIFFSEQFVCILCHLKMCENKMWILLNLTWLKTDQYIQNGLKEILYTIIDTSLNQKYAWCCHEKS